MLDRRLTRLPGPFLHAPPAHHAALGFDGHHWRRLAHCLRQPCQSHARARFRPREGNPRSPRHGRHAPAYHRPTLARESFSLRPRWLGWSTCRVLADPPPLQNLSPLPSRPHPLSHLPPTSPPPFPL